MPQPHSSSTSPAFNPASNPGPFVLKIGGTTLEAQSTQRTLWDALLSLHERLSAKGSGVVVVHGGGKAVDSIIAQLGMPTRREQGLRITPPEQMEVIAGVLAGSVNKRLVGCINAAAIASSRSARAVGLCLGDGDAFPTERATLPFDAGRVGEVVPASDDTAEHQTPPLLRALLGSGFLPVLSSIGIDSEGGLLNVNADDAAAGIARMVRASTLALLTDVPGVKGADGRVIPSLRESEAHALIASGVIAGGMIPKVRSALATAKATGSPVVVLSADPAQVQELLQGKDAGTKFVAGSRTSDARALEERRD
jgi:acetylglutamate kinase